MRERERERGPARGAKGATGRPGDGGERGRDRGPSWSDKRPPARGGTRPFAADERKPRRQDSRDDRRPSQRDDKRPFAADERKPRRQDSRDDRRPNQRDDKRAFTPEERKPRHADARDDRRPNQRDDKRVFAADERKPRHTDARDDRRPNQRDDKRASKPGGRPGARDEQRSRDVKRPAERSGRAAATDEKRTAAKPAPAKAVKPAAPRKPAAPVAVAIPAADAPRVPVERAGFVGLVGRPNVGKSTLLNQILGEKLAITSPKPQTTRNRLLGVKHLPGAQLALVDTPGLHRPDGKGRTLLNQFMVDEALGALADVDVVLLVTDLREEVLSSLRDLSGETEELRPAALARLLDPGDRYVVQQMTAAKKPILLAVNKIDLLGAKSLLLPLLVEWGKAADFRAVVPISAATGEGVDRLLGELVQAVPQGGPLFDDEMLTDRAERFLVTELIREQVFMLTRQELPYSVAVTIDQWEERIAELPPRAGERIGVVIDATVHIEKQNQKKIVVGEHGQMIRDIGAAARQEVSRLLGCGVHLSLFVRVDEEWTASPHGLRQMGYT